MIELPRKVKDMTGQKFNRWTVLSYEGINKHKCAQWLCVCDCGNENLVLGHALRSNHSKSCGCHRIESSRKRATVHGMQGTPTYTVWDKMIGRCHRKTDNSFKHYGERGISVCDRWRHSFVNFYTDMGDKPDDMTLDRINNYDGYSPDNCRWATYKEQSRNTRRNHLVTFNGETLCIAEWTERLGYSKSTIHNRIKLGWSIERMLTEPVRSH